MHERCSSIGIKPHIVIVGTAMGETEIHRASDRRDLIGRLSLRGVGDKAGNATHIEMTLDISG